MIDFDGRVQHEVRAAKEASEILAQEVVQIWRRDNVAIDATMIFVKYMSWEDGNGWSGPENPINK